MRYVAFFVFCSCFAHPRLLVSAGPPLIIRAFDRTRYEDNNNKNNENKRVAQEELCQRASEQGSLSFGRRFPSLTPAARRLSPESFCSREDVRKPMCEKAKTMVYKTRIGQQCSASLPRLPPSFSVDQSRESLRSLTGEIIFHAKCG